MSVSFWARSHQKVAKGTIILRMWSGANEASNSSVLYFRTVNTRKNAIRLRKLTQCKKNEEAIKRLPLHGMQVGEEE